MFGFNWIDGIIIIVLIGAIIGSLRIGFFKQIFVITGFFGALFLAGWLFPHILPIKDRTLLTLVNANLVLITATYAAIKGYDLGHRLHWSLAKRKPGRIEVWLGVIPGVIAALILVWLLTTAIGRLPFEGFSNSANDALIVQKLNRVLPPVPAVFGTFNRLVDPNSPPSLFVESKPNASFAYSSDDFQTASAKGAASVVRLTSFGCGGVVTGSGFAVGRDLVATNAHVIAGVKRPIVKYGGHSFQATPVLFDPNLDLAIIRVESGVHAFEAPPLKLAADSVISNATVAVLGYPGGNYTAAPGIVRNGSVVFGRNIYDLGVIGRDVYEVQTTVGQGISGGPIVTRDGQAVGIIFSKSDSLDNYAYALNSSGLQDKVDKAEKSSYRQVSTGQCLAT